MAFDPTTFRKTMRLWATGVTVVSAQYNAEMRGMTVSSFTSVTLDPPLILVCIQKQAEAAEAIIESGSFAVSMLGQGQEHLSNLFAGFVEIPEGANRFDGIELLSAATGSPILKDAMGWLDCKLHSTHDGSTHHIFIGEVVEASGQPEHPIKPLIYYNTQYRKIETDGQ